ncbi:PREDICTED: uncharacterized protein LOC104738279 [Camelina sativa]|uniref:Uncharacterized protein LOC104738277 n=1 Tax=Camelina sativa TaxID=90675 RepID=A0ABM0VIN4_CAMSA|nr:PREDICTED: uncharacterized protein LOC104738277 [Camelina sativa]XP_010456780.1 PREDICTED: uncharacterized protein LOC104738279 [Camelina sativa]
MVLPPPVRSQHLARSAAPAATLQAFQSVIRNPWIPCLPEKHMDPPIDGFHRTPGPPTPEAVASQDLWIWHTFFGPPGTLNDINVLDRSPVFDDILQGHAPKVNYFVNGREYHLAYYLTDARFAIFKNPALVHDKETIGKIMRACIILHNMIVEDERDEYRQLDPTEFAQVEAHRTSHVDSTFSTDIPSNVSNMMTMLSKRKEIRNQQKHQQLKDDLVENI